MPYIFEDEIKPQSKYVFEDEQKPQEPDFEGMIENAMSPMVDLGQAFQGIKIPNIPKDQLPEWTKRHPELYSNLAKAYETAKPTIEMLSTIGGGAVGTMAGPAGTLIGSGVGYSGAKALGRNIESMLYGKDLPAPVESVGKTARDIAIGSTIEGAGQLVSKGLEKIFAPFARRMTQKTQQVAQQAKELGLKPTPSDLTQSTSQAQFEALMSRLFGSGHVMRKNDMENTSQMIHLYEKTISEQTPKASEELGERLKDQIIKFLYTSDKVTSKNIDDWGNQILKTLGSKERFETLGKQTKTALDAQKNILYNLKNQLYSQVDELVPETYESPAVDLKQTAQNWLERFKNNPVIDKSLLADLENVARGKTTYNWNTLEDMRRIFRDESLGAQIISPRSGFSGKGMIKQGENYTSLVYGSLKKAIENDQQSFLDSLPGGIGLNSRDLFTQAKKISGEMAEKFKNSEMLKIIESNAEDVIDAAFKPRGIEEINALKNALGKEKFEEIIQPIVTNKLMLTDNLEKYSPEVFNKQLDRYGKEVIDAVYGQNGYTALKNVARQGMDILSMPISTQTERKFLENLIKQSDPKAIVSSIFTSGESKYLARNFDYILKVSDQPTKDALKYNLVIELFTKNQKTNPLTDQLTQKELETFSTKAFRKTLFRYRDVLGKVFDEKDINLFRKIANVGDYLKSAERIAANPSGTASGVGQMGQMAATVKYLLTSSFGMAAGVTGLPYVVARLYMSPLGRKYLTEGFQVSATSLKGVDLMTKMTGILTANELEKKQQVFGQTEKLIEEKQ